MWTFQKRNNVTQPEFTCSKSTMKTNSKFDAIDVLLTLSRFHTLFWCFHYYFEQENLFLGTFNSFAEGTLSQNIVMIQLWQKDKETWDNKEKIWTHLFAFVLFCVFYFWWVCEADIRHVTAGVWGCCKGGGPSPQSLLNFYLFKKR